MGRLRVGQSPLTSTFFGGLAVLVAAATGVLMAESRAEGLANNLGYGGATAQISVVSLGDPAQAAQIVEFIDATDAGLAFLPTSGSGVLTLYDPNGYFQSPDGPLGSALAPYGPAPAALVSEVLGERGITIDSVVPSGTQIAGSFEEGLQLQSERPVVVGNLAAGSLGSGDYTIVGDGAFRGQRLEGLLDSLVAGEAWIGQAAIFEPVSSQPFGSVYMVPFTAALVSFVVAAGVALSLAMAAQRPRLRVVAVLGGLL